ncbi:ABC transporter ATP-binding protein [Streptomyces avicenniae]|uniref:ABC transporter ATP-binding protein n=1 Tax=Streptomyces avicenniae TaxID=500153 RepID=UPI00069AE492|nr:ABC transporter ATP-binding protein [Streptomyces avicenniae]
MRTTEVSGRQVLWRAVAGQRRNVAVAAVLGAVHQAAEVFVPVLIGVVVDRAVATGDGDGMVRWLLVLALVYVGLSLSFRLGARAGERAAERSAHGLRIRLVDRVLAPGGGADEGRLPGVLASVATEDTRRVGAVSMAMTLGIGAAMGLLVGAVVLLRISPALGLLVLLGVPVILVLGHYLSKPLERRSAAEQERAAHASGVAADLVAGLRVLKGIGAVPAAVGRYRDTSQASLAATLRAARAEAWQNGLTTGLIGVFIAVVALVGGRLAAEGDVGLGELVAAVGLALFLISPLQTLAWVNAELAQGRASAARIAEVLSSPHAVPVGGPVPGRASGGVLRLRDVHVGGLRGFDLEPLPGEVLGVAVTDPAHAVALVRCLGRETEPEAGGIELDGVSVTALDPAGVRRVVLVAAHDADLFDGTVAENIMAGAPAETDITAAMAAAGADELVHSLPEGAGQQVGERGRFLSGGQRQRVALARALAADPPVLVLHDPTTAVDTVTEARIATGLRALRAEQPGRVTVLITTSPALLAVTDRVVWVDGGRTVDTAPHDELVQRHSSYRSAVLA